VAEGCRGQYLQLGIDVYEGLVCKEPAGYQSQEGGLECCVSLARGFRLFLRVYRFSFLDQHAAPLSDASAHCLAAVG
jgi:hypothetical protein